MALALSVLRPGWQRRGMFALTGDAPGGRGPVRACGDTSLGGRDPRRPIVRTTPARPCTQSHRSDTLHAAGARGRGGAERAHADRLIVAGYSVGELAALGCRRSPQRDRYAGPRSHAGRKLHGRRILPRRRTALRSRPLPRGTVDRLCERPHDAAIAIVDPGDAFVLGGSRAALPLSPTRRRR